MGAKGKYYWQIASDFSRSYSKSSLQFSAGMWYDYKKYPESGVVYPFAASHRPDAQNLQDISARKNFEKQKKTVAVFGNGSYKQTADKIHRMFRGIRQEI